MEHSFCSKLRSSRLVRLLLSSLAALTPAITLAQGLPTIEDPSRGPGDGIIATLQNYSYDIVMLVSLVVIATMFTGVCYHAYTTYAEIHSGGRKTWGEFGLTVIVGAILLVLGIWLLTNATEIL